MDKSSLLAKGMEYANNGQVDIARLFFSNVFGRGNYDISQVNQYVLACLDVKMGPQGFNALGDYDDLLLLIERAASEVAPESIMQLVELHRKVKAARHQLASSDQQSVSATPRVDDLGTIENILGREIPSDRKLLQADLNKLDEFISLNVDIPDESTPDNLINLAEKKAMQFRTALEFMSLYEQIDQSMAESSRQEQVAGEAYCLQIAEAALRQMFTLLPNLSDTFRTQANDIIARMQRCSEDVGKRGAEQESQKKYNDKLGIIKTAVDSIISWNPPNIDKDDKACQKKIEELKSIAKELSDILAGAGNTLIGETARVLMEKLANRMNTLSEMQQQRYNQWAFTKLRATYEKSIGHVGTIYNDHTDLADSLVDGLGNIDLKYLHPEVSRCYSEVFEYLFNQLKGPKDNKDFATNGRKLNVLNRITERQKINPNGF